MAGEGNTTNAQPTARPHNLDAIPQTPGDILVTIRKSHPMRSSWCDILIVISR